MNYLADYFTEVSTGTRLPLTQFESDTIGFILMIGMCIVFYIAMKNLIKDVTDLITCYLEKNPAFVETIDSEETATAKEDSDVIMWDIFNYPDYDINIRVEDQED